MPFARIWYEPAGVKITYLVDGADIGAVARVLIADGHVDKNATFEDVDSQAELEALLPPDRSTRDQWVKAVGPAKVNGKVGVAVKGKAVIAVDPS